MATWVVMMGSQAIMFIISGILCIKMIMDGKKGDDEFDKRLAELQAQEDARRAKAN